VAVAPDVAPLALSLEITVAFALLMTVAGLVMSGRQTVKALG